MCIRNSLRFLDVLRKKGAYSEGMVNVVVQDANEEVYWPSYLLRLFGLDRWELFVHAV